MAAHRDDHYDAIIIGGGLGGLTAGAKLSREGRRVLLIEQHRVVGGCATTFRRKEYAVEVGLHMIDGLDQLDSKRAILEDLEIFNNVEFVPVPEFYRFVGSKADIVVPCSIDSARATLTSAFPDETKGIDAFFSTLAGTRQELARMPQKKWQQVLMFPLFPLLFPKITSGSKQTLGGFLEKTIRSEELKLVLSANVFYYGDDPYTLSLLFFAVAQASYFMGGGHFVKGGSQRLSDHLARFIQDNGGAVLTGHEATGIVIRNGRASGVRFRKTRDGEEQEASGTAIIANASIPSVVNDLLPRGSAPAAFVDRVNRMTPSPSVLSLYLGFKTPPKELGNRCYSTLLYDGVERLRDVGAKAYGGFDERPIAFVDYSQIDSGLAPAGKSLGVVATVDSLSDWEGLPAEEYQAKKEQVAQTLIGRLNRLIPGISEAIEYQEVATAKTILRYTRNPHGSITGFAQTPEQSLVKRIGARSPVDGLYFASAWAFPGGGFSGAMMSGHLAALQVLRRR